MKCDSNRITEICLYATVAYTPPDILYSLVYTMIAYRTEYSAWKGVYKVCEIALIKYALCD